MALAGRAAAGVAAAEVDRARIAVAVLPYWSSAVTVKLKALPAVALAGPLTTKCVAAAALTRTAPPCRQSNCSRVSVAVNVWLPAVFSVALNVPTPLVKVALAAGPRPRRCC